MGDGLVEHRYIQPRDTALPNRTAVRGGGEDCDPERVYIRLTYCDTPNMIPTGITTGVTTWI